MPQQNWFLHYASSYDILVMVAPSKTGTEGIKMRINQVGLGGGSGINKVISAQQKQAGRALQQQSAKIEQAKQQGGRAIVSILSSGVTSGRVNLFA
jgi:hypothetical protein